MVYTRNETNGLAWFKTGIWKLKAMRTRFEKGTCPLCKEKEDARLTMLEVLGSGGKHLCAMKWLNVREDTAYKRIINCSYVGDLKHKLNSCTKLYVNEKMKFVR